MNPEVCQIDELTKEILPQVVRISDGISAIASNINIQLTKVGKNHLKC